MGEIATFIATLGLFLQIPQSFNAIEDLLLKRSKKIEGEELKRMANDFANLKDNIRKGSNLQGELNIWKKVHDAFTEFQIGMENTDKYILGTDDIEDMPIRKVKRQWETGRLKAVREKLRARISGILDDMKEEIPNQETTHSLDGELRSNYNQAIKSKNRIIEIWKGFKDSFQKFEIEIKKTTSEISRENIHTYYMEIHSGVSGILIQANAVLINLLSILRLYFYKLGNEMR